MSPSPSSAAACFVYLHTDHLNTPRLATDDTQTVLWRWEGEAFGITVPDEDPDGDHLKIILSLRFPGQYADAESGLYYNWNRYYDPKTGRYVTSDPVGLDAGFNTYAYVGANPLRSFDLIGLFTYKTGVPKASAELIKLLDCIEQKCSTTLVVTSTTDNHPADSPHRKGKAVDIRYPSKPQEVLCCAAACDAQFALDEKKHPSPKSTAPHLHIQLTPGMRGGRGDLPVENCERCE